MEWQLSSSKAVISLCEVLDSLKCQASYCTSLLLAWKLKVSHWQFEGKFDISQMSLMIWKTDFIKCTHRYKGMLKFQLILFPNSTYLACELVSNYMTRWLYLPHVLKLSQEVWKNASFSLTIYVVWCSHSNCLWTHPEWDWWRQSYMN